MHYLYFIATKTKCESWALDKPLARRSRKSMRRFILGLMLSVAIASLFSAQLSRSSAEKNKVSNSVSGRAIKTIAKAFNKNIFSFQETIATFAGDCVTPKTSFFLGETVCAQTDGVDLNFPGGRWVHWLREDLSIAFGGSGTTLITQNPQSFTFIPDQIGTWKVTIAETGDPSQTPAVFTVSLSPETIATYDSSCNLAQDNFSVGDTVCAKADPNFSGTRFIYWVNSQGEAVQTNIISSTNPNASRMMNEAGNYWVYFSDSDGTLRDKAAFTVSDPAQPQVDLSVHKNLISGDFTGGSFANYQVVVTNKGPDTAASVVLTESVPNDTTFVSVTQDSGPTFNCTSNIGNTVCSIAALTPRTTATFTFVYQINGGITPGNSITNVATITSTVPEQHSADNSDTLVEVARGGGDAPDCTLDCPNNIVTTATVHGQDGGANVNFGNAEGFGSCGAITSNPASGTFFPIGTTTVTVSSETGGGFCSFTVTVIDSNAPTITCPGNITVTANEGEAQAFVPNPNGGSSNVGTPTATGDQPLDVVGSREDGEALTSAYPIGLTEIVWIATDPSGRQATCTQSIRINSNQLLTISCPANVTASSPTGCDPATVNPGTATSNSSTATISASRSDGLPLGDPFPIGNTIITWTATDTDTQSASCNQTVTVTGTDTTPPTLVVPPSISLSTSSCSVTLDDELGVATADEDCGTVSISRTGIPTIACPTPQNPNQQCESFVFPTGATIITYTATNSSGLSTTAVQTVTVTESPAVPPTISAPADVTAFTGPGSTTCGTTVSDATLGTATANDNCPGVVVTRSGVPTGNNFPVGMTTVTYTATDRSGNTATATQVVTVIDNTAPTIVCPTSLTLEPTCPTGAIGAWTAPVGTDNCPGATTVQTAGPASGSVFPIGSTTVTYSVTDAHSNATSCSFTVTVLTPQQVVQNLINTVNGISSLSGQQRQGLVGKLTAALDAINDDKKNVACNKLADFINQVSTFINNGTLTSGQGQPLINSAANVRNNLGCTSLPCT